MPKTSDHARREEFVRQIIEACASGERLRAKASAERTYRRWLEIAGGMKPIRQRYAESPGALERYLRWSAGLDGGSPYDAREGAIENASPAPPPFRAPDIRICRGFVLRDGRPMVKEGP